jgi:hypothetical protein
VGFFADVANKIRTAFSKDKEQLAVQFAKGSTASGMPTTGYDLLQAYGYDVISDYLRLEHDLLSRYVDYEEMDDYPEIAAAIDIFADDATQLETQLNRTLWVTSPDKDIEKNLDYLFQKTLRIDEEIWEIARTLVKYGNDFEELLVTNEGVRGFNFLPPPTVRRIEGPRGELYGFVQDFKGRFGYSPAEFQQVLATRAAMRQGAPDSGSGGLEKVAALEDWEVVHFRLRGKHRRSIYGYSVLESARWIWKRLMLLEDAALIYRLQRAPERYAFYVDVGDLPPQEALAWTNRVRQQFKKKKYINPTTGKLDLKFEPLAQDEDFFIPVRKGTEGTRIEVLGSPSWQHMDDIEYFRDKLFAAMKIPKAYLAQDESTARSVLSSEDVRFARTVLRVQREIRNGLSKVCRVHLAALGIDPATVEYDLHMTTPSAIFELAQLEVRNARADLAGRMREFVSLQWLLSKVFGLNDDEISVLIQQREEDKVRDFVGEARAQAAATEEFPQFQPGAPPGAFAPQPGGGFPGEPGMPGEPGEPGAPGAPGEPEPDAEPGEGKGRTSNLYSSHFSRSRSRLINRNRGGISERERLPANRDAEKRAEEKLDRLLKNDRSLAMRLSELGHLLNDMRSMSKRSFGGK